MGLELPRILLRVGILRDLLANDRVLGPTDTILKLRDNLLRLDLHRQIQRPVPLGVHGRSESPDRRILTIGQSCRQIAKLRDPIDLIS